MFGGSVDLTEFSVWAPIGLRISHTGVPQENSTKSLIGPQHKWMYMNRLTPVWTDGSRTQYSITCIEAWHNCGSRGKSYKESRLSLWRYQFLKTNKTMLCNDIEYIKNACDKYVPMTILRDVIVGAILIDTRIV